MSLVDMDMLPLEVAEKLVAELQATGTAYVLYALVNGVPAIKVLTHGDMHCATCQCARIAGVAPAPDNRNSKSWHSTASDFNRVVGEPHAGPDPAPGPKP